MYNIKASCGCGEIGRRTRLRIWRATVGVRVPSSAPFVSNSRKTVFFISKIIQKNSLLIHREFFSFSVLKKILDSYTFHFDYFIFTDLIEENDVYTLVPSNSL